MLFKRIIIQQHRSVIVLRTFIFNSNFKYRISKMDFSKIFFFVFACIVALSTVSGAPSPKWKFFKKIERVGQNIRDGIIKAGPAVQVVGQAATIYKGK
ncbi:cecropin-A-like [Galleria mellonella]|uniref:Cecropin-A-like n=1 Tax=Galleria mellonella TaxID=7137 RepID=A0ABM3MZL0_GALME|nr:cecropin-A-like [Galleria mellonella]